MNTLYLVATPIGNLEDMSPRAVRILREAALIAAEDTRHTGRLLAHFKIHAPLTSYFEHNKLGKLDKILAALAQGDVALVSDAGTPAINDPGYELVRAAIEAGYAVSPVPGPSAPVAALAASGLPTDSFLYLGYLPRKSSERKSFLGDVAALPYTLIFLETPHRLLDALVDIETVLGDRQMAAARELTKLHEEIWRGTVRAGRDYFERNAPRGEFTLVVAGQTISVESARWTEDRLRAEIASGLGGDEAPSALSRRLARESGWERRLIYQIVQELADLNLDA
ncbi:MAG: 16S rRNA (cytidine(1402)-2'-O)-methyltransferase [Chloroflexi bacterium HGW-Chloroflexi-6]|nr:MAG: 16S rRNA (cytidine(1402)-2'-O)-methyltransferase [Chloroflexi bacterium HGW-Chloroflexi-6]